MSCPPDSTAEKASVCQVAGSCAASLPVVAEMVDRKAWDSAWEEALVFLAGMLGDPTPMVFSLADERSDDLFRHRLALAARCLGEISAERLGSSESRKIRDGATTAAFSLLWQSHERGTVAVVEHLQRVFPALAAGSGEAWDTSVIEALRSRMRAEEVSQRLRAMEVVEALIRQAGLCDARIIGALVERLLNDDDAHVRGHAAHALGTMGEPAAAYPGLIEALLDRFLHDDDERNGRGTAAWALGAIGRYVPDKVPLLDTIVGLVDGPDRMGRFLAMNVLSEMGEAISGHAGARNALVRCLIGNQDSLERAKAAETLGAIECEAPHPDTVGALTGALRDESGRVREDAIRALDRIGDPITRRPEILHALLHHALDDDYYDSQRAASRSLASALAGGKDLPRVLDTLISRLDDGNRDRRVDAAKILGVLGEAATNDARVLRVLVDRLQHDDDAWVQEEAGAALGAMGDRAAWYPGVVESLRMRLHDPHPNTRSNAARALGDLGEAAAQHPGVLEDLVLLVRDMRPQNVGDFAAGALQQMGEIAARDPLVIEGLIELLRDPSGRVRHMAMFALSGMGRAARHPGLLDAIVVCLRESPQEGDPDQAARTLAAMGEAAARHPSVLDALLRAVLSPSTDDAPGPDVRSAAEALAALQAVGLRVLRAGRGDGWRPAMGCDLAAAARDRSKKT